MTIMVSPVFIRLQARRLDEGRCGYQIVGVNAALILSMERRQSSYRRPGEDAEYTYIHYVGDTSLPVRETPEEIEALTRRAQAERRTA
ncbi:MAG: hypothetical protein Q8R78_01310 [Candidatus Omnitrophota bacterium]|nr:hypothetical protein [Candidatus Omnitrophota bacterium]